MNKHTLLVLSALSLAGCNSDGDQGAASLSSSGGTPDARISGIWEGTASNGGSFSGDMVMLIDENSSAVWSVPSESAAADCTINVGGNDLVATCTGGPAFTGKVVEGQSISGEIEGLTGVKFELTYRGDLYETESNLSFSEGIWQYSNADTGYVETQTIALSGSSTGNDNVGCVYAGTVSIINTSYNLYNYTQTLSNCDNSGFDGIYTGKAFLGSNSNSDDIMYALFVNNVAFSSSVYILQ